MIEEAEALNAVEASGVGQLAVSEVFGPTFQGEGSTLGRYCYFLRLAGCNQHCVFCDTPYTWAFSDRLASLHRDGKRYDPKQEVRRFSADDVCDELAVLQGPGGVQRPSMLVISGGEPMLQQYKLMPLIARLAKRGWRIEIETAGTVFPLHEMAGYVHQFNVSPKLENSGNELRIRYRGRVLDALQATGRACWKFVATSVDDIGEIRHIVQSHQLSPIYIMPEGVNVEGIQTHMRTIAQAVLNEGWNLTTRLQIELWGNRRGV